VAEQPPYDNWLPSLHRAMLTGIAERMKFECTPPTELRNILKRLEEKKHRQA
jgi:hypothetical protein